VTAVTAAQAIPQAAQNRTFVQPAPILDVTNLDVLYGNAIQVLRGVSLQVPDGAVVSILGANGAGKTTLLRAVSGLLGYHGGTIAAGSIRFDGTETTQADPASLVRGGMAQVMEGRRIFAELTVHENLGTGAYARKDRNNVSQSYDRVMELFPRLQERRNQVAGYMSGGEQQMLAIGRALMANPRLLLLDEPSLGLAPLIVEQIFDIVQQINSQGTSVLIVEQNAAMALRHSSFGYVMETGRVTKSAPSADLLADDDVKNAYLGGESSHTSFRNLKTYRRPTEYIV
jgi:branched-chain amino acid transport system ATP-binding protein